MISINVWFLSKIRCWRSNTHRGVRMNHCDYLYFWLRYWKGCFYISSCILPIFSLICGNKWAMFVANSKSWKKGERGRMWHVVHVRRPGGTCVQDRKRGKVTAVCRLVNFDERSYLIGRKKSLGDEWWWSVVVGSPSKRGNLLSWMTPLLK